MQPVAPAEYSWRSAGDSAIEGLGIDAILTMLNTLVKKQQPAPAPATTATNQGTTETVHLPSVVLDRQFLDRHRVAPGRR